MKYDPSIHHRKSLRLQGYDYSQAGGYFVTIVTQRRDFLFGEIQANETVLNEAGKMIVKWWNELPHKFPSTTVDEFVVMPNHIHGIIFIHESSHEMVGADLRVCPDSGAHPSAPLPSSISGIHSGVPLPNASLPGAHPSGAHTGAPLPEILQWFKTMTTNEYIRGVKGLGWVAFDGKLWQRNYYEHILRNHQDYERIANYILTNPSHWADDEENK